MTLHQRLRNLDVARLRGMKRDDAEAEIRKAGLVPSFQPLVNGMEPIDRDAGYRVFTVEPGEGTVVAQGTTVTIKGY